MDERTCPNCPVSVGSVEAGEPEKEIRPVDEFYGERPDKEVRAGCRPREGYPQMNEYARLRWQCRRGLKELDVLLEDYLTSHFANAAPEEQRAFSELLTLPDPVLLGYVMGRESPENEEQRRVIARLRRTTRT